MYYKKDDIGYITPLDSIHFKTLIHGASISLHKFKPDKGSTVTIHSHPHEQTGYLFSGNWLAMWRTMVDVKEHRAFNELLKVSY